MTTAAFIRPAERSGARHAAGAVLLGGGPTDRYRRAHRPVGGPRAERPNLLLRRCLAALGALLVLAVAVPAVGAVVAGLAGDPAAAAGSSDSPTSAAVVPATHVVAAGETLWSIAGEYRGDVAIDRYVDALIRLNGGTVIQVGQAVRLP